MRRLSLVAQSLAILCLAAAAAAAQSTAERVRAGVVYDSLNLRPLGGALITFGAGRSAVTDDSGRFTVPALDPGRLVTRIEHEMLDSLGYPFWETTLDPRGDSDTLRLAIPGFETFWARECGSMPWPREGGLLIGQVRDAGRGAAVAGTQVRITWSEVGFDAKQGVSQEWRGGTTETDRNGRFTACGVPRGERLALRLGAASETAEPIPVDVPSMGIVYRSLALRAPGDDALVGVIAGSVRDEAGTPVAEAVVEGVGGVSATTDAVGRFVLKGLPIGTRLLRARAIGFQPSEIVAEVWVADTAKVSIPLARLSVLETVEVTGTTIERRFRAQYEERRALGIAKFVDSTSVERFGNVRSAILARSSARIQKNGSITFGADRCIPTLWIDRQWVRPDDVTAELAMVTIGSVAALEVYERKTMIPTEYWPSSSQPPCAVIVVWTKRMFP